MNNKAGYISNLNAFQEHERQQRRIAQMNIELSEHELSYYRLAILLSFILLSGTSLVFRIKQSKKKVEMSLKEKELAMFLQVAKEDREEFREILRELLAEGKLTLTVKGKYMKSNGKVLTGTFISNAKGFGFVEVEGRDEDLFIPEDKQGGAFHKDTVEVALLPAKTGKRQEAQVIRIIVRGMTQVVGTYEQSKSNFGFVIPDNTKIAQDIFVPKEWSKGP